MPIQILNFFVGVEQSKCADFVTANLTRAIVTWSKGKFSLSFVCFSYRLTAMREPLQSRVRCVDAERFCVSFVIDFFSKCVTIPEMRYSEQNEFWLHLAHLCRNVLAMYVLTTKYKKPTEGEKKKTHFDRSQRRVVGQAIIFFTGKIKPQQPQQQQQNSQRFPSRLSMQAAMTSVMYGTDPELVNGTDSLYHPSPQMDQEGEEDFTDEDYSFWCNSFWQDNHQDSNEVMENAKVTHHDNDENQDQEVDKDYPLKITIIDEMTDDKDLDETATDDDDDDDGSSLGVSVADFLSDFVSKENCDKEVKPVSSLELSTSSVPNDDRYENEVLAAAADATAKEEEQPVSSLSSSSVSSQGSSFTFTLQEEETLTDMSDQHQEDFPRTIWCFSDADDGEKPNHEAEKISTDECNIASSKVLETNQGIINTVHNPNEYRYQANGKCADPPMSAIEYVEYQPVDNSSSVIDESVQVPTANLVVDASLSPPSQPLPPPPPTSYMNEEVMVKNIEVISVSEDESRNSGHSEKQAKIDNDDRSTTPTSVATAAKATLRIQPYQNEKWICRYKALLKYREKHGNCNVPFQNLNKKQQNDKEAEEPILSQWVKRQRHQYKLRSAGKRSHLTDERVQMLEDIGFIWDSHAAAWEENFESLRAFQQRHGHCHVPIAEPRLSTWMKRQRRQYKAFVSGNSSTMTQGRVDKLNKLGFVWYGTAPALDAVNIR